MHALLASLPLIELPEQVTQRLAWVLVHFVWQGAAVAGLLALTLWLGRVTRPSARYACGLVALAVMVACPVVTFVVVRPVLDAEKSEPWDQSKVAIVALRDEPFTNGRSITEGSSRGAMMTAFEGGTPRDSLEFEAELIGPEILEPHSSPAHTTDFAVQQTEVSVEPITHEAAPVRSGWSRVQPWIVSGWLLGVASLSLRLLLGWLGVWRLRRRVEPVPEWLAARVTSLAQTLRVARPLIHLSHRVTEAVAVGFLKPMILLPVAWITELKPDMIEAVIAHELAHIRRGDLWVNLIQRLVETLLFYHPAVWWLSRQLRIDRELCCDELVVRTLHNPLRYAETLEHVGRLSLAHTRGHARSSLPSRSNLTVSIGSPRHILLARIRAILAPPQQARDTSAWLAGLIPLVVACLIGWSLLSRSSAPANDEPQPNLARKATSIVRASSDDEPPPTEAIPDLKTPASAEQVGGEAVKGKLPQYQETSIQQAQSIFDLAQKVDDALKTLPVEPGATNELPQSHKLTVTPTSEKDETLATDAKRDQKLRAEEDRLPEQAAMDRAVQFLKSQQRDDGMWPDQGENMVGGKTALATLALLQAGVKSDDAAIQKALPKLRQLGTKWVYVVALQTMALCAATPQNDAELIRRNVSWLEETQAVKGEVAGGWSYQSDRKFSGADGSNTHFAVMALNAAERANFKARPETWRLVSDYWMSSQAPNGGWSYTTRGGPPYLSMTLAGVSSLASANRFLPKDDQTEKRDEAIKKGLQFVGQNLNTDYQRNRLYTYHCLKRACRLFDVHGFDRVDWRTPIIKRLIEGQRSDGAWTGGHAEDELVGTSFALMFLSGEADEKGSEKSNGGSLSPKDNGGGSKPPVTVPADQRNSTSAVTQPRVSELSQNIIGRVVDADGKPVANAEVMLVQTVDPLSFDPPKVVLKTKSDAQGVFKLADNSLKSGRCAVWAVMDGKGVGVRPASVREAPPGTGGLPDETVPQDSPDRFVVRLNWAATRVVVSDADAKPVAGAKVSVTLLRAYRSPYDKRKLAEKHVAQHGGSVEGILATWMDSSFFEIPPVELKRFFTASTNAEGVTTIPGVAADRIRLASVETDGLGRQDVTLDSLYEGQRDTFEIRLKRTGRLEGEVTLDPQVLAAGFKVEGLRLRFQTGRRVGPAALRRAGPPQLEPNNNGGPALEASLSHPTEEGQPERRERSEVQLFPTVAGVAEAIVDVRGRFEVPFLAEGQVELIEPLPKDSPFYVDAPQLGRIQGGATLTLTIPIHKAVPVKGVVRKRGSNEGVARQSVILTSLFNPREAHQRTKFVVTDEAGRFEAHVPLGPLEYGMNSTIEGFATVHAFEHAHARASSGMHAVVYDADEPQELPPLELVALKKRTGQLLDVNGQPAGAGCDVHGFPTESKWQCCHAKTNDGGEFTLSYPESYPPTSFTGRFEPTSVTIGSDRLIDPRLRALKVVSEEPFVLQSTGTPRAAPALRADGTPVAPNEAPELMRLRQKRIAAHDKAAATKLVGVWKVTMPKGFVFHGKLEQQPDGLLKLSDARAFNGVYTLKDQRLEFVATGLERDRNLAEQFEGKFDDPREAAPRNDRARNFVWNLRSDGSLLLMEEDHSSGADYVGAVLERVAAAQVPDRTSPTPTTTITSPKLVEPAMANPFVGSIIEIDRAKGTLIIDRGEQDGLPLLTRFDVYPKATKREGFRPTGGIAEIQVTRILDAGRSEARINLNNEMPGVGDLLHSATWTPRPKPGQAVHGEKPSIRGRVMIDGPIPVVPMRTVSTSRALMPRNNEVQSRGVSGPDLKLPDDSLVIGKEGGIANVAIYLRKAPNNWKPTPPPTEPVVIEAIEHRFSPHMSFIRTEQPLMVKNSLGEAANFHSLPIHAREQNVAINFRAEMLIKSPYTKSERLPNQFGSGVHPWMRGYLLALDHPFAAITDADGRFEIRDLPPGEHHFIVWHERRGYLNKDLMVRVEVDKVAEVNLKFAAAQFDIKEDAAPKPDAKRDAGVVSLKGRVRIDGPIPVVPPLKIQPTLMQVIPRNLEDKQKNERWRAEAPWVELPDDSLVISKEGGIANVAVYLKKAPGNWKPTPPPTDPVVIEAVEHRFSPHMAFIRAEQPLKLKNSMNEVTNFHSFSVRGSPQNLVLPVQGERLIKSPYSQSESLPNHFVSDIHRRMDGYLLAFDHPFAAITDADGRFEIRDLPPDEHHFIVWHERRGYLNKDLVVRVEDDKVSEVELKYTTGDLERRDAANTSSSRSTSPPAVSPVETKPAFHKEYSRLFKEQKFAEAALVAKQAKESELDSPVIAMLLKQAVVASRLAESDERKKDRSPITEREVELLMQREDRHEANEHAAAAKLVGRWKLTLPAGFVHEIELKQNDDGLLSLTSDKNLTLQGRFAVHGSLMELVQPNDKAIDDFVWEHQADDSWKLTTDENHVGGTYLGAKLERK